MQFLKASACAVLLYAVACASGGATSSGPHRSTNVITADEWANANVITAYDAIQRLRPEMFRMATANRTAGGFGAGAPGSVWVYLDDTRLGDASALRQVPITEIREIRYLSAPDASARWGPGHTQGAFLLRRRN